jgi:hypothetical protein
MKDSGSHASGVLRLEYEIVMDEDAEERKEAQDIELWQIEGFLLPQLGKWGVTLRGDRCLTFPNGLKQFESERTQNGA